MNKWIHLFNRIHIHPLFWAVAGLAIITARFRELLILFIIVFIHELGHAITAAFFSWRIKSIILLPFGGVAEFEEHGNKPLKEEALVVLAGPLQHVWLILIAFFFQRIEWISEKTFITFTQFNLSILLFNLLPIWPLDGGRLLYVFLSRQFSFVVALKKTIQLSYFSLIIYSIFILVIFPYHLNGWLIAGFLFLSLRKEWKQRPYVMMRFLIERYSANQDIFSSKKTIPARKDDTLQSILHQFHRGKSHTIYVYENGQLIGCIGESAILKGYFEPKTALPKISDLLF